MTATTSHWYTCAETAQIVRSILKATFPGQKFSVRSKTYSGGASIDVRWTDGPTRDQVEDAIGFLAGGGFDGSIDMAYSHDHWRLPDGSIVYAGTRGTEESLGMFSATQVDRPHPDAVRVRMGADFIFCERDYSPAFVNEHLPAICARYGLPTLAIETYNAGAAWHDYWLTSDGVRHYLDASERRWINQDMTSISTYVAPETAPAPLPASETDLVACTVEHDRDWTWINFASKPAQDVIDALKDFGARWSKRRSAWYITRPVAGEDIRRAIAV